MLMNASLGTVTVSLCFAVVLCVQEQTDPRVQCPTPKTSNVKVVIRTKQNATGHWISRVGVKQRMDSSEGGEADHWQVDVEQNTETCEEEDSVLETVFYLSAPPSTRGKPLKQTTPPSSVASTSPTEWICPTCSACPSPVTPQPPPKTTEKPPSGYLQYHGVGFYKLHTHGAVWLEARETCEREGGYLVVINSEQEARAVESVMNFYTTATAASNNVYVYVGAHKIGNEYITVLGGELSKTGYVQWLVNEPSGGNEFCLSLQRPNAHFNDVPCSYKLAFICELTHDDC